jgi:plastocyanin
MRQTTRLMGSFLIVACLVWARSGVATPGTKDGATDRRSGRAASGAPELPAPRESAIAADLTGSGRDSVLFGAAGGQGLAMFLPEPDGGFSLQLLPAVGNDVVAFAAVDGDADGIVDLIVAAGSDRVALWKGDGLGSFIEPLQATACTDRAAGLHAAMGHAAMGRAGNGGSTPDPAITAVSEEGTDRGTARTGEAATALRAGPGVDAAAPDSPAPASPRDEQRARLRRLLGQNPATIDPTRHPAADRAGGVACAGSEALVLDHQAGVARKTAPMSVASADFDGDGRSDTAVLTNDGRVHLLIADRSDRGPDELPMPASLRPRLLAAGHFMGSERVDLAIVGTGKRPRLVVLENLGPAATSAGEGDMGTTPRNRLPVFRERVMAAPLVTVNVSVGSGGFLFSPDQVAINPGDSVKWTWATSLHTVTSGSGCVPDNLFCSPNNTNCATAPASSAGATYTRAFPTAGSFPYFCTPHCGLGMVGLVSVLGPSPGRVPDGLNVPGTELRVQKSGANIQITWSASCSAGANNYAVYEGTLPINGTYTHVARDCALGNVTSTTLAPSAGQRYYLIVPETSTDEGSYGLSSAGAERPQGGGACKPRLLTDCP